MLKNTVQLLANLHRTISGVNTVIDVFARVWEPTNLYVKNRHVRPSTSTGFYYFAQADGISGAVEPTWPTILGGTVVDGTITWEAADGDNPKGWPTTQIAESALPVVFISEGTGEWSSRAGDILSRRSFDISVLLHPEERAYYPIARNDSLGFIRRCGEAYLKYHNRYLISNSVMQAAILIESNRAAVDSGLIVTDYLQDFFYAINWTLQVEITILASAGDVTCL